MVLRAGDLQVTAQRRRTDNSHTNTQYKSHPQKDGMAETSKADEKWQYTVKVANESFIPSPALQAQYIIFIQRQNLGAKTSGVADSVEKVKGSAPVAAINAHSDTSFETSEVSLRQQSLMGGWVYTNGGRIKATDSIEGIWVRFMDGDKQVAEYVNPSNLSSKFQWEK